jgi:hypothetical protein
MLTGFLDTDSCQSMRKTFVKDVISKTFRS